MHGFISGSILMHCSVFVPHKFDYLSFVVYFEMREHDTSTFVLLSQIVLAICGFVVSIQILELSVVIL